MCTIITKKVEGERIGWKVVQRNSPNRNASAMSYYKHFTWFPNSLHVPSIEIQMRCGESPDSQNFHCFARRSDARDFKKQHKYYRVVIIRLILSDVSVGEIGGMGRYNGLPAVCGEKAYWDGKFHS